LKVGIREGDRRHPPSQRACYCVHCLYCPQMFSSCGCGTPSSSESSSNGVDDTPECWVLGLLCDVIICSLPLVWSLAPLGSLPVSSRMSIFGGSFPSSRNSPLALYKPLQMSRLNELLNPILQRHAFICGVTIVLVKTTMLSRVSVPWCGCPHWGVDKRCMYRFFQYLPSVRIQGRVLGILQWFEISLFRKWQRRKPAISGLGSFRDVFGPGMIPDFLQFLQLHKLGCSPP